jgi:hypothetical protein
MPENLTELLRRELTQLDQNIREFTQRKQAIENLLNTYSGAGGGRMGASGKLLAMPSTGRESLSTLDMAQRVLEQRGELKAEEIMEAIRQEFGIKPAHTLPQMLYIRARARKRFYRSPEGRFGILETGGRRKHHAKRAA